MSAFEQTIPDGYKQTEVGVIPEDWIVEPLESFTSFISYGFTNPMPTVYDGPPMITARDINQGRIQYSTARCTSEDAFKKLLTPKSKPKANDLLLTKDGTLGRLALVDKEDICINQSVALLRPNSKINPSFFKLLLESPYYQEKMLDDAGGSTIKHIYITIVNRMLLGLPSELQEQTAIANALSDVDALLTELEKLISKKQAIKTATMQQLLTGKTRLPQFSSFTQGQKQGQPKGTKSSELGEIPEDWDVRKFKDITTLITCGIAATPTYVPESQGYPFLSSTNIKNGNIVWENYKHIDKNLHRHLYKNNPPLVGDILYSRVGTIGEAAVIESDFEFSVYVSLTLIKPQKELMNSHYLAQLLNSTPYKNRAKEQVYLGGGVGNLNVEIVRSYPILIPPKEEQTAIATILSDMDNEIQTLEKRLAKTRQIKQGMMQELLTGRIRLPFDKEQ